MRGVTYLCAVATATGALVLGPVAAAQAAPPANDGFAGATAIGSVPYSTTEDTTQATLDSADAAALVACSAPAGLTFGNSVWFAYTPEADQELALQTSGSDYSVAYAVLTGAPGSFSEVTCGLSSTTFTATAGTTYYIDLIDVGSGGGALNFSLATLVPPNPILTVDPSGTFDSKSGTATVTGTASCGAGASASVDGSLSQPVGRIATISGFGFANGPIVCDGTPHPWSFVVTPQSGKFKGGHATASVFMGACNFTCANQQVTQTITLKG